MKKRNVKAANKHTGTGLQATWRAFSVAVATQTYRKSAMPSAGQYKARRGTEKKEDLKQKGREKKMKCLPEGRNALTGRHRGSKNARQKGQGRLRSVETTPSIRLPSSSKYSFNTVDIASVLFESLTLLIMTWRDL